MCIFDNLVHDRKFACGLLLTCSSEGEVDQLHHRARLDRRRLETGHLKYAMLMTQSRYPGIAPCPIPMAADITYTLQKFTPPFYDAFTRRYSGEECLCLLFVKVMHAYYHYRACM